MTRMILAAILVATASNAPADEGDICIAMSNLMTAQLGAAKDINTAMVEAGTMTLVAAKTRPDDPASEAANAAVIDLVGKISPHIDTMRAATDQAMSDLRRLCIDRQD